jgi:protein tyrosine phosphatase
MSAPDVDRSSSGTQTATDDTGDRSSSVITFLRRTLADPHSLPPRCSQVIDDFLYKVEQLRLPSGNARSGFEREYLEICWSIDRAPWYEAALTPQTKFTKAKNRYRDVLPFEKTRVHLLTPGGTPAGDYINANFVDSHYIACCAPVPAAIRDFWHMVWECDVHVILMLTNFVERERLKADVYWDKRGRVVDFGGVNVQLIGEAEHSASQGFTVRMLKVWRVDSKGVESPSRVVQQLQLMTWPDHGVLQDFRVVAPMLEMVNAYRQEAVRSLGVDARVVVHCSAGIGRSGTFIAIDIILRAIHSAMDPGREDGSGALLAALDVQQVVHRIRSQRPGMVQTPEQYEMVYRYLAAVLSNRQPW